MKKFVTLAALAVAVAPTFAEMVSVSNVLATTKFEAIDRKREKTTVVVRLTDASRLCGSGELEAIVTFGSGRTESGCWRVVGDSVYLTRVIYLGDTVIPVSQFEGSPLPTGAVAGSAAAISRESSPSGNYAGQVRAAIRPNINYSDVDLVAGNPSAEFDVDLTSDGTIVGVKLHKSSGVPGWDEAAERAIRKTDKLPRDGNGRIYSPLIISLRPKD